MDQPETRPQTTSAPSSRWLPALAVALALLLSACGSSQSDSELNRISKPNLTEQDIRNYLGAYKEIAEVKQKALRAKAPHEYTQEQMQVAFQQHHLTADEFTFIGARINNALALLDREKTTPIPEAYKADCELVRRLRAEIEEARKPVPFP